MPNESRRFGCVDKEIGATHYARVIGLFREILRSPCPGSRLGRSVPDFAPLRGAQCGLRSSGEYARSCSSRQDTAAAAGALAKSDPRDFTLPRRRRKQKAPRSGAKSDGRKYPNGVNYPYMSRRVAPSRNVQSAGTLAPAVAYWSHFGQSNGIVVRRSSSSFTAGEDAAVARHLDVG